MGIANVEEIIKEKNIVVFAPHYDDFPLMMAGYIFALKQKGLLDSKHFTNVNVFSRTNYQLRDLEGNKDISLKRIKYAVGIRVNEDMCCLDDLFGDYNYKYRLLCEYDCQVRGKKTANSEMEFHHGMYEDFEDDDFAIMKRVSAVATEYFKLCDTAVIFPIGFKEHIDHFIVREAGRKAANEGGSAKLYFAEEKPLSGIANEIEIERINALVKEDGLTPNLFRCDPEKVSDIVFKHYLSQVEPLYREGVINRAKVLSEFYKTDYPLDCNLCCFCQIIYF